MSALNCFKVAMIDRTARRISDMSAPEVGKGYAFFQYVLRYFLTAIVIGITLLIIYFITGVTPFLSFDAPGPSPYGPIIFGFVVGLFTMKFGVIAAGNIEKDEDDKADKKTEISDSED
jgi:hypothetical protein